MTRRATQKKDLVLEIDVQGALQVKQKLPGAIAVFVLPPSRDDLEHRIRDRGQDSEDEIRRRLERARQEMLSYSSYDFAVVNDDLERAGREVQAIALGSRCRVAANGRSDSRNFEIFWRLNLQMAALTSIPESQFAYVVVVSRRARQLMIGGRPMLITRNPARPRASPKRSCCWASRISLPEVPEGDVDKDGKRRK